MAIGGKKVWEAFFRASKVSLAASFSGWREPLEVPLTRPGTNPFTGRQEGVLEEWDPRPAEVAPYQPDAPPFPHEPFFCGYWWEDLSQLVAAVVGDEAVYGAEAAGDCETVFDRGSVVALFGGGDISILSLPDGFTPGVAGLTAADCRPIVEQLRRPEVWDDLREDSPVKSQQLWDEQREESRRNHLSSLCALQELAHAAVKSSEQLWFWVRHSGTE